MTYILNIETATKNCSVSLAKNGNTIAFKEIATQGYSHAECLHVFVNDVLNEAKVDFNNLNAVAVSCGPGSYTGLRIGVSAAKGFCFALNIPLISVGTLSNLAQQVVVEKGKIVPMIDARRMEVFSAVFDSNHQIVREVEAQILDENSFENEHETLYFVGDSNEKAKSILKKSNFIFLDDILYPSAKEMSAISYKKFKNNEFEDLAYFEPFYLKDFLITKSSK